jgi:hypothetical protein
MIYLHLGLPGRLYDARDFARQSQFTEANTAQTKATNKTARAPTTLTAIPNLHCIFAAQFTILHTFFCHRLSILLATERHSEQFQ